MPLPLEQFRPGVFARPLEEHVVDGIRWVYMGRELGWRTAPTRPAQAGMMDESPPELRVLPCHNTRRVPGEPIVKMKG